MSSNMRVEELMQSGQLYPADDPEALQELQRSRDLSYEYNLLRPSQRVERAEVLARMLGKVGQDVEVIPPFHFDFGSNIELGDYVFLNYNCVILDEAKVRLGNHVFVGPMCGFYTAGHPLDVEGRNALLEYARPITIEDDVWIGGHVCFMPGVTVGRGSVIGGAASS